MSYSFPLSLTWSRALSRGQQKSLLVKVISATVAIGAVLAAAGLVEEATSTRRMVTLELQRTTAGTVTTLREVANDVLRLTSAAVYDSDVEKVAIRLREVRSSGLRDVARLAETGGSAADNQMPPIQPMELAFLRVVAAAEDMVRAENGHSRDAHLASLWHAVSGFHVSLDRWLDQFQQREARRAMLLEQGRMAPWLWTALTILLAGGIGLATTVVLTRLHEPDEEPSSTFEGDGHAARLIDLVQYGTVPAHTVDRHGVILWANQAELSTLGYRADEYIGHSIAEFHVDSHVLDDMLQRLQQGESLVGYPARLRARDGSIRNFLVDSSAAFEGGQLQHTRCFSRDVTRQIQLEDAYRTSERRLRTVIRYSPSGIFVTDAHGRCSYVNDRWCEWTGLNAARATERAWMLAVHPDDREQITAAWEAAAAARTEFHAEYRLLREDHSVMWVTCVALPIRDDSGALLEYVGTATDISPLKLSNDLTRDRESRLRAIVESAADGILVVDRRGVIESLNPAATRLFGYQPQELIGRNISVLMPSPFREQHDGYLAKYLETGQAKIIGQGREVMGRMQSGELIPLHLTVSRMELADGVHFTGIVHDLRARREAQEALREAELRFRTITNHAPVMIWECDATGARDFFNQRWIEFTGRSAAEDGPDGWSDCIHPDDRPGYLRAYRDALASQSGFSREWRARRHDGIYRWLLSNVIPRIDQEGTFKGLSGTCVDVTDQKAAAERLRLSEERLALVVEKSSQWIWDHSLITGETYFSPETLQQLDLGITAVGDVFERLFAVLHPADQHYVRSAVELHLQGQQPFDIEHRLRLKSGGYGWFRSTGAAVRDHEGRAVRFAGSTTDISVLKQQQQDLATYASHLEEAKLRIELQASELRLAGELAEAASSAKGEFLANMSHEVRTPLNAILGMTELVLESPLEPEQQEMLKVVRSSGEHLLTIINEILDFSKLESGKLQLHPVAFELLPLLQGCARMLEVRADEKGLRLDLDLAGDLPGWVLGDDVRLRQIVLNLLGNAIKFTATGSVTLAARRGGDPDQFVLVVTDTGIGIPAEKLTAIFQPFSQADNSTIRSFGGTGLGLSIVSQLAAAMDGWVEVTSRVGHGSEFTVTVRLPAITAPASAETSEAAEDESAMRSLSILVAEDSPTNQRLIRRVLERLGHTATVVENGAQALDRLASETFDLVLMDLQMPMMDGLAAVSQLRRREQANNCRPLPVIALTANALAGDRERCLAAGMTGYATKPIRRESLMREIRRVLAVAAADASTTGIAKSGGSGADSACGGPEPAADSQLFGAALESDTRSTAASEALSNGSSHEVAAVTASHLATDDVLARLDGSWEFLVELVDGYALDSPTAIDELLLAGARRDASSLRHWSHRLKGSTMVFGDTPAAETLQQLEDRAEDPRVWEEGLLERAVQELGELLADLKRLRGEAPAEALSDHSTQ